MTTMLIMHMAVIMTGIRAMGDVRMRVAVMMVMAMMMVVVMIVVMIGMTMRRGACHHRRELRRGTAGG